MVVKTERGSPFGLRASESMYPLQIRSATKSSLMRCLFYFKLFLLPYMLLTIVTFFIVQFPFGVDQLPFSP